MFKLRGENTMTYEEIAKGIDEVVISTFPNIKDSEVDNLNLITEDGILDSINILSFICNIEEKFKISIVDEDLNLDYFENNEELAKLVSMLIAKKENKNT